MSLPVNEVDQVAPDAISTRNFLEPLLMRTFYVGVIAPLLFRQLGSSDALVPYLGQSRWLVDKLAAIWPALPPQYDIVLHVLGAGHAASFGFLCGALWAWPIICGVVYLWKHAERCREILPVSPKEIGQLIVACPVLVILAVDQTKTKNPLFAFQADQWGFFYLRQWFLFSGTAMILGILIYAIGRWPLNWVQRRIVRS
jgi:hypothetical protein